MILPDWHLWRGIPIPGPGAVHSPLPVGTAAMVLTPDSHLGTGLDPEPHLRERVYRVASPHWLPPQEIGEILAAKEWALSCEFAWPGAAFPDLDGIYNISWQAGTYRQISSLDGVETHDIIDNTPGWATLGDALGYRRHPKPPPDEDDYQSVIGYGGVDFESRVTVEGTVAAFRMSCVLRKIAPAWHAESPPTSSPPLKWEGHEGLSPCWWFDFEITAAVFSDVASTTPDWSTRRGYFNAASGAQEIGTLSTDPDDDAPFEIELSIADSFDEV